MTLVRIHKLISRSGLTSLRQAEVLIRQGRVQVDGEPARIGQPVDAAAAEVRVDGIRLPVKPDAVYVLLNKPRGAVSAVSDERGRPTVVDLVGHPTRIHPVGRLDMDSEGLLILTNDGTLTNLVTHPRHGVTKTYVVRVRGLADRRARSRLVEGVRLEDGTARAVSVRLLHTKASEAILEMVMAEGRKREVRRMCEAVGLEVLSLFRSAIGPITDTRLKSGEFRELTIEEVRSLYAAAGDSDSS